MSARDPEILKYMTDAEERRARDARFHAVLDAVIWVSIAAMFITALVLR